MSLLGTFQNLSPDFHSVAGGPTSNFVCRVGRVRVNKFFGGFFFCLSHLSLRRIISIRASLKAVFVGIPRLSRSKRWQVRHVLFCSEVKGRELDYATRDSGWKIN